MSLFPRIYASLGRGSVVPLLYSLSLSGLVRLTFSGEKQIHNFNARIQLAACVSALVLEHDLSCDVQLPMFLIFQSVRIGLQIGLVLYRAFCAPSAERDVGNTPLLR